MSRKIYTTWKVVYRNNTLEVMIGTSVRLDASVGPDTSIGNAFLKMNSLLKLREPVMVYTLTSEVVFSHNDISA